MNETNHEYYVSSEIAKLLEKAGFDWKCRKCYNKGVLFDMEPYEIRTQTPQHSSYDVLAPTLDVAQRWLREVKNYYVNVDVDCDSVEVFYTAKYLFHNGDNYNASYIWEDTGMNNDVKHRRFRRFFDNYEEALETSIKKALEIILEKGE